jgi:aldose 1-epimerase
MFPMLPYANRIAGNQFDFEGRTYRFAPNFSGEPLNLHGTGWQSAWTARLGTAADAELRLDHIEPDEPYSYSASQKFAVGPDRLNVTLQVVNRGERTMPFGLGLHPWWKRETDTLLQFRSTHFWLEGPGYIATDQIVVPPELDFSKLKPLPKTWRNNCYSGWDGHATIRFPNVGFGLHIEADPVFRHLMLYCDPSKPVFCLEPQTHASGALNRLDDRDADLGVAMLARGESIEGTVSFIPFELEKLR